MLNVFLTVDTEIWPFVANWPTNPLPPSKSDFAEEIAGYIRGETGSGDYGVQFQMEVLNRNALKATYFVEALFSGRAGNGALHEIVDQVQSAGHEVQLHVHTEWLRELADPDLPAEFQQNIHQFSEDAQTRIVAKGIANLTQAGARNLCAFRAGNYGASLETLRALARNGIAFDSSHNSCFLDADCQIRVAEPLQQPTMIDGVCEFPVTVFSDYPGHVRHAQLCACSFQELEAALLQAWQADWYSFVIVWHSFELMRRVREPGRRAPDWMHISRFEKLCNFLAANRDKFRTAVFSEIDARTVPAPGVARLLRSPLRYTARRFAEQMASRLL